MLRLCIERFALGVVAAGLATLALAQDFPTKPIRMLIPYPAASGPDLIMRTITPHMQELLGQPIVIENKGGGGGVPAIVEVKSAPADGYTLLAPDSSQWAIYPAMRSDAPYDTLKDFTPVALVYTSNLAFYVNASSPIKDMRELTARAKANPGKLRYGVTGVGGIMHLTGAAYGSGAGVQISVVPYRASAEAVAAVLRGDLDFAVSGWQSITSNVKAGKLRALGLSTLKGNEDAPGVPSVADAAGLPGFNYGVEYGVMAKSGTPKPVIDKLNAAFNKSMTFPDVIKQGKGQSFDLYQFTPDQFGEVIRAGVKRYSQIIKEANIKAE